jgi:hypothetical protein
VTWGCFNSWVGGIYSVLGMMTTLAVTLGVLAVLVMCAVFRVNIFSLLPWYPGLPKRFDDRIQTLGSVEPSDPEKADTGPSGTKVV